MEPNHIMLGLEDDNRPSFSNYLKDILGEDYNRPPGKEREDYLEDNPNYGDLLFYIGLKHDVDALKKVRDEVGLVYCSRGLGGLVEAILDHDKGSAKRDVKNEMISILADCGWYLPKDSMLLFGEQEDYMTYLILSGITKENADKIMKPLHER